LNELKRAIKLKYQLMLFMFVVLGTVLTIIFAIAYNGAKQQVISVGEEMFTNALKDSVGMMDAMNQRVKSGELTLEQAQEAARTYIVGPKKPDGYRDTSKTKMSQNDYMFFWAFKLDGTMTMHADKAEGANLWDYQVTGKYTVRDTWANPKELNKVVREIWQNENEPVYTYIAYQASYEPWGWIVGAGGRESIIYERRLAGMQQEFLITALLSLFGALVLSYVFARTISNKIEKLNVAIEKASVGDLTQTVAIGYKDEFGQLADKFNKMTGNLREMIEQVSDASQQVAASSQQISSNTEEISSGVARQANDGQKITEMFMELSIAIDTVARSAEEAAELSENTMTIAKDGGTVIRSSIDGMNLVNEQMSKLEEDSNKIGEIIEVIDDIAEQTNLLALNAAIEAARAGEQGRGFAVVADEVRKLAERSGEATKQITVIIKGMQANTQGSVKAVAAGAISSQQTGEAFERIISMVNQSASKVTEIAAASEEQSAQSTEVLNSMQSISGVIEESAASSQETASTAQSLAALAEKLNKSVSVFKIN
jgi:methyl-accepting chemotaxis protein